MRHGCVIAVLWCVLVLSTRVARPDETVGKALIQQAYQKTRGATTIEEFNAVLELCAEAESHELAEAHAEYLSRLKSWAHNKRGEASTDLAMSKLEAGDAPAAKRLDAEALEDFENAVLFAPERWKPLQNRAVSYALAGRYEDAVEDFSRVIELNPEHANAWFNRAELRYDLGRYDDAVVDYTEALALEPEDFGALTGRGHANYQTGRYREALEDYHQAIRLSPEDPDAYANRGDAFLRLGEWEQAARDYRRTMRLAPEEPRGFRSVAWLLATCPDDRFRDAEQAIKAAEKAFDNSTGSLDPIAFDTLAAAYANAGQFKKARQTISRGIELAPRGLQPELRQRLEMYGDERPYRESVDSITRTVSATSTR